MILNKYNSGKTNATASTADNNSDNNYNTSSGGSGGASNLNRELWGNKDGGQDINDSMWVNGSIYLKADFEDDDNEENGDIKDNWNSEDEEEETPKVDDLEPGSIRADNLIETKDLFVKNAPYINYPKTGGKKTDIRDLFTNFDGRIKTNSAEINTLKTRVSTNETNITNLTTTVNNHTTQINNHTTQITNNTTNISYNADEIAAIKKRLDELENTDNSVDLSAIEKQLKELKYGTYNNPVVVLSGSIEKSSYSNANYKYTYAGSRCDLIEKIEISYEGGLMTVNVIPITKDGTQATVTLTSVAILQELSGDTANNNTSFKSTHSESTSIGGRSDGWHGFESWIEGDKTIKIREFHQKNGDNDSWGSDNWNGDGGGIRKIKIIGTGYSSHVNLY